MTSPQTGAGTEKRPTIAYPRRTKLIIAAVLAVALGALALGFSRTVTDNDPGFTVSGLGAEADTSGNGVEARIPGPGDSILGQETVGIDLAPGWTGELVIQPPNGPAIQIPEDELDRVRELNQLLFQPFEGKVIERFDGGQNCVAATIWDQVRGRDGTERLVSWCFSVL